ILILRAKLAIARFFPKNPELTNFIANVFGSRMQNGAAIGDIADIYGKNIDVTKVLTVAKMRMSTGRNRDQLMNSIAKLTQDERMVLSQYLSLYNISQNNQKQYQASLQKRF
ncbi:MAG: hypothetical protein GXP45_08515, partial [bacterium]|nr:hypothetical protein [bacterium]